MLDGLGCGGEGYCRCQLVESHAEDKLVMTQTRTNKPPAPVCQLRKRDEWCLPVVCIFTHGQHFTLHLAPWPDIALGIIRELILD